MINKSVIRKYNVVQIKMVADQTMILNKTLQLTKLYSLQNSTACIIFIAFLLSMPMTECELDIELEHEYVFAIHS